MKKKTIRTTLTLPLELIEAADRAVKAGFAKSRNEFVAISLESKIAEVKKEQIDREFAKMTDDREYTCEVIQIESEFDRASWEALHLGDKQN